jgi:hypothetical protein
MNTFGVAKFTQAPPPPPKFCLWLYRCVIPALPLSKLWIVIKQYYVLYFVQFWTTKIQFSTTPKLPRNSISFYGCCGNVTPAPRSTFFSQITTLNRTVLCTLFCTILYNQNKSSTTPPPEIQFHLTGVIAYLLSILYLRYLYQRYSTSF